MEGAGRYSLDGLKRLVSSTRLHSTDDGKSDLEDSEKRDMNGNEEG